MRKLPLIAAVILAALGGQASQANETPAGTQYADVRVIGQAEYFSAKMQKEPIREQDTLDLIKQDGHSLQLDLERWSIDNLPPGRDAVTYYPTGDKLDAELNGWNAAYGSYTGKRPNLRGAGFYPNPLTAPSQWVFDGVSLPLGWTAQAPGNFTYLYQTDDAGRAIHYLLAFYGQTPDTGIDVDGDGQPDGVMMTLSDGTADHEDPSRPWYCQGVKAFDHCPPGLVAHSE